MRLLADWKITHQRRQRTIELFQGDLAALPPEHAVDLLVVSAFPNHYTPLPGTLIGALATAGISVQRLAQDKQATSATSSPAGSPTPPPLRHPQRTLPST